MLTALLFLTDFCHFCSLPQTIIVSKNTPAYLKKLEQLLKEGGLKLRYEKGSFKSGYCLLEAQQVVVVNKFYTTDTKIQTLTELIQNLSLQQELLSPESKRIYSELQQTEIKL
jgi:hypothetical protein